MSLFIYYLVWLTETWVWTPIAFGFSLPHSIIHVHFIWFCCFYSFSRDLDSFSKALLILRCYPTWICGKNLIFVHQFLWQGCLAYGTEKEEEEEEGEREGKGKEEEARKRKEKDREKANLTA